MRRQLAASLALTAALATTLAPAALAQSEPAGPDHPVWKIVQPNEPVGGQTYEEWARDYTQWLLWDRTPENPPPDATQDCEGGQPGGDVFFLPHTMIGTTSEYACAVGADQHLLVFLGGWIDWADDGQTGEQVLDELYDLHYQSHGFEFTLDGVTVPVGSHMALQPDVYSVDFGEDNLFGLSARAARRVAGGPHLRHAGTARARRARVDREEHWTSTRVLPMVMCSSPTRCRT